MIKKFFSSPIIWRGWLSNYPNLIMVLYVCAHLRYSGYLGKRRVKRVIYIDRPIFDYEIDNLSSCKQIKFVCLSSRLCKQIFRLHFPRHSDVSDHQYFVRTKNLSSERQELQAFWRRWVSVLTKLRIADAFLSCNFIYALHIELNQACVRLNIPFLVIYRESINPTQAISEYLDRFLGDMRFIGHKIFFYNPTSLELYERVPGINKSNSVCIGFPRVDRHFKYLNNPSRPGKVITLFLTDPIQKWKLFPEKLWIECHVPERLEHFYSIVLQLAQIENETKFLIKLKKSNHTGYLHNFLERHNLNLANNVEVLPGGDPLEVLKDSKVICGFHSSVLLEGIIFNRPVVEPKICNDAKYGGYTFFWEFHGATNYVESIEELKMIVDRPDHYQPSPESRDKVLVHYYGYLDGNATKRTVKALDESIEQIRDA